jgi:hypothetical protein
MQPMRILPFDNVWAQSIVLLNKQLAAAIDLQLWLIEMLHFTATLKAAHSQTRAHMRHEQGATVPALSRVIEMPGHRSTGCSASCDLNDRIGNWVNEGGAGGEVNR